MHEIALKSVKMTETFIYFLNVYFALGTVVGFFGSGDRLPGLEFWLHH